MTLHHAKDIGARNLTRAATALCLVASLLTACRPGEPPTSQVSEKPETLPESVRSIAEARPSRFGLRARVSYTDIETIAAEQLPEHYPVTGERQVCKRIIGIKACGTALWNLNVLRTAPASVSGENQYITLTTPIRIVGSVGIRGSVAEALGLDSLNVYGLVNTHIRLGLSMQSDWCPRVQADVNYHWVEKPTALWRGRIDFDLEQIVNDALDKQLATLEPRINKEIDCQQFRSQLASYWRSQSFALDIPSSSLGTEPQQLYLNIVPTGFAFSGIHTESDKFGVSFEATGTTVVASTPLEAKALQLPPLQQVAFQSSSTDFDLLLRADYTQLEKAISPLLIDRIFTSESTAGRVSVLIKQIDLSGSHEGVSVALNFSAQLPGSRGDTHGIVYLNANPVVDVHSEQLHLENIRLSKVLDSTLWSVISTVFEGQIISAIERGSTVELGSHTRKLEQRLQEQLQDPSRTGGVHVQANKLSIALLGIFPEANALAARARVSAELDIDIPLSVLKKPLKPITSND